MDLVTIESNKGIEKDGRWVLLQKGWPGRAPLWKILYLRRDLSDVREEKYFRLLDEAVTVGMGRSRWM